MVFDIYRVFKKVGAKPKQRVNEVEWVKKVHINLSRKYFIEKLQTK